MRGTLSPVNAAVLKAVSGSNNTPSKGTRSPVLTSISSPTPTVSGATVCHCPSRRTVAVCGRTSNNDLIWLRALSTARS